MTAPHNYSEWIDLLDLLKTQSEDASVLAAFQQGTLEWQTGVAERFIKNLTNIVGERLNKASDKFQLNMSRSQGEERLIVQAILALRKEMIFLFQIVDIQAIPDEYRNQLKAQIQEQADEFQKSLEKSAQTDRTGKMNQLIRNHKVNALN